jgi:hypothetical protein
MSIDRFSQLCFLILNRTGAAACKDHVVADRTHGLYDSLVNHYRDDGFHLRHRDNHCIKWPSALVIPITLPVLYAIDKPFRSD